MITKKTFNIILAASVLMLTFVVGLQVAQPTSAQTLAQANLTIPYAGSLVDQAGQPAVDGTYEVAFALYASQSGGEALWTEAQSVTLQEGAFNVQLGAITPLSTPALDGGARWLEIAVRGPGEADFTLLSPRQEVSASVPKSPTASSCAHDHWAETWSGSGIGLHLISNSDTGLFVESNGSWASLDSRNTNPTGIGAYGESATYMGVVGHSKSTEGIWKSIGVKGFTNITTGDTTGVWGEVASSGAGGSRAQGVVGWATALTGLNYGVWGQSESSGGTGVYGQAENSACTSGALGSCIGTQGRSASGNGVLGYTTTGVAILAYSAGSGNLIEAYRSGLGPELKFRVSNAGNVTADGTYTSPAADMAEMLPAVDGLEPGDILVIGEDGQLTRCSAAYQSTVVGVYSTKPAFLGGGGDNANLAGQVPLAIIGVVPAKVSAENGPIRPGDLLVASSTPGYAMKAGDNPPVGTIIGKALAALPDGLGVIQILVMLQ